MEREDPNMLRDMMREHTARARVRAAHVGAYGDGRRWATMSMPLDDLLAIYKASYNKQYRKGIRAVCGDLREFDEIDNIKKETGNEQDSDNRGCGI